MPVLESFRVFRPASGFASWDRDLARNPTPFYTALYRQPLYVILENPKQII
jgi:hypothetical protein